MNCFVCTPYTTPCRVAWLIGWALILEYSVGGAAVARGISPNLVNMLGGPDNVPFILSRVHLPGTSMELDPVAAMSVAVVTVLLSVGIKEVRILLLNLRVEYLIFIVILLFPCLDSTTWYPIATPYLCYHLNPPRRYLGLN